MGFIGQVVIPILGSRATGAELSQLAANLTELQPPASIPWTQADLAYYFVTLPSTSGVIIPSGQSTSDIAAFVADSHASASISSSRESLSKADSLSDNVKALYSIGGRSGSEQFAALVADAAGRTAFVQRLKTFLDDWSFDGIGIGAPLSLKCSSCILF